MPKSVKNMTDRELMVSINNKLNILIKVMGVKKVKNEVVEEDGFKYRLLNKRKAS